MLERTSPAISPADDCGGRLGDRRYLDDYGIGSIAAIFDAKPTTRAWVCCAGMKRCRSAALLGEDGGLMGVSPR
jgi:hypothetical protein